MTDRFYITTPIYYVNADPHLGHLYATMLADTVCRFNQQRGRETYFLTGTDEHSQKIERAAEAKGIPVQAFVDGLAGRFREVFDHWKIGYDQFIRTTSEVHKAGAQELWRRCRDAGLIYKSVYAGWYCVQDNAFIDGPKEGPPPECPDSGGPAEWVEEESYFFRLSSFQEPLLAYYRSQHVNQSWLGALACVLDATALRLAGAGEGTLAGALGVVPRQRHASPLGDVEQRLGAVVLALGRARQPQRQLGPALQAVEDRDERQRWLLGELQVGLRGELGQLLGQREEGEDDARAGDHRAGLREGDARRRDRRRGRDREERRRQAREHGGAGRRPGKGRRHRGYCARSMPRPGAGTQPAGFDPAAALAHLRAADAVLAELIDATGPLDFEPDPERASRDHYAALLRAIVGQQLSTKVAAIIWGRMLERFGGRPPTPQQVLDDDPDELRAAVGLSRAKTAYLRSLAEHVLSGELDLDHVSTLSDEELIRELTAVKGLGEWTAHMFLMFQLQRPDILAVGDLGVRRAVQLAYGLDDLPARAQLTEIGEPWRPYRSVACRVLWHSLDNAPG